jgi:hypothetical protein
MSIALITRFLLVLGCSDGKMGDRFSLSPTRWEDYGQGGSPSKGTPVTRMHAKAGGLAEEDVPCESAQAAGRAAAGEAWWAESLAVVENLAVVGPSPPTATSPPEVAGPGRRAAQEEQDTPEGSEGAWGLTGIDDV